MFVLGIGKDVDPSELNQIASGPKNVFTVDSFEDLDDKAREIRKGICVLGIFPLYIDLLRKPFVVNIPDPGIISLVYCNPKWTMKS